MAVTMTIKSSFHVIILKCLFFKARTTFYNVYKLQSDSSRDVFFFTVSIYFSFFFFYFTYTLRFNLLGNSFINLINFFRKFFSTDPINFLEKEKNKNQNFQSSFLKYFSFHVLLNLYIYIKKKQYLNCCYTLPCTIKQILK